MQKALKHLSLTAILDSYDKKGLTEQDAITQAQVSYILQWEDYDFKNKKIKVWKPGHN